MTGAVVAQLAQAVGSFLLQVLAARLLGAEGLAQFALLYGVTVVATAVSTGLVGDSLTVLDRRRPALRAGLQWWATRTVVVVGGGSAAVVGVTGGLSVVEAVWFAAAATTFVVEDLVRRMLMATMRFWAVVVIDVIALVGSVGLLVVVQATTSQGAGVVVQATTGQGAGVVLATFLVAMAFGQTAAAVVGWSLLDPAERRWVRRTRPDRAAVWRYGSWRALQHAVRPFTLLATRVVVIALLGGLALGELEAARLFVAPAVLAVNGASNHLFASFATSRAAPTRSLLQRADRGVAALLTASLLLGGVIVAALPWLGDVIAAGRFEVSASAVAGWTVFAAATAAVTPYGVLAAVRVPQARVFAVRAAETAAAVVLVTVVLALGGAAWTVPVVIGGCSAAAGAAIRSLLVGAALFGAAGVAACSDDPDDGLSAPVASTLAGDAEPTIASSVASSGPDTPAPSSPGPNGPAGNSPAPSGPAPRPPEGTQPAATGATVAVATIAPAPPTPIDESADDGGGLRFSVESMVAVDGEASGPGEIGGPALQITLLTTNTSTTPVDVSHTLVDLRHGAELQPAAPFALGTTPFSGTLAPGRSATAVHVFAVPVDRRSVVQIHVNARPGLPTIVFEGAAG